MIDAVDLLRVGVPASQGGIEYPDGEKEKRAWFNEAPFSVTAFRWAALGQTLNFVFHPMISMKFFCSKLFHFML